MLNENYVQELQIKAVFWACMNKKILHHKQKETSIPTMKIIRDIYCMQCAIEIENKRVSFIVIFSFDLYYFSDRILFWIGHVVLVHLCC